MKTRFLLISGVLVLAFLSAACGGQAGASSTEAQSNGSQPGSVTDVNSLMEALRTAGAAVELGDEVEQAFFTVPGQIIKVNGADVQVFVYDTSEAMEAEASQVAEDGGSIGTNMVMWVEAPHFYKLGQILALYVGEDQAVNDLLEGVFGPQFAGR
jgi:hypothetical protein